jgi:sulfur-carrier protein adenylyltransferase/sulfurtransferase
MAGGRSRAAAQLLAGNGFREVYNLKGGISAWNGLTAAGPAEMGMSYLRGDEDLKEIICLAYGMEEGLRGFYTTVSEGTDDPDLAGLADKLSEIEERHKERLFALYVTMHSTIAFRETFESDIVAGIMEGGFTTDEFLDRNRDAMTTVPDLLNIAMMLEAQALDLYMRYSEKIREEPGKGVLYDLAEEEKGHLASLGRLMDKKV